MKHIGFISTRFSGTDGVSLESSKWAEVFQRSGHECYWFAGELDRRRDRCFAVPEAHFHHPEIRRINDCVIGRNDRSPSVTDAIHRFRVRLKKYLYRFISRYQIDLLIAENVLTIPMNVPLGLAIAEIVAESQIPTIAHHHDFFWERRRYDFTGIGDYLNMAFPPRLDAIEHVVINTMAREALALRTGVSATVIPNVLDFESPPRIQNDAGRYKRYSGFSDGDVVFLQPTRVVQRKGIEHAIELISRLGCNGYKLLISHEAGDEGYAYAEWLRGRAAEAKVDLRFIKTRVRAPWYEGSTDQEGLSLWDVYPHAAFVTYPSAQEGFGNAFLEAVYFKKPILVNRYATFVRDIEPLGFQVAAMDGFITQDTIDGIRSILFSPETCKQITAHNYRIAASHFSYDTLRQHLNVLILKLFKGAFPALEETCPSPTKVVAFQNASCHLPPPVDGEGGGAPGVLLRPGCGPEVPPALFNTNDSVRS